jgi:hypothetical protein
MIGIVIDVVVILLLTVTIYFCWRLNTKISEIRGSRQDLIDLVKTFDQAVVKTNKNISDLREMSTSSTDELQAYVEKAGELLKDLAFMTDTAAHLADRLEKGIVTVRSQPNVTVNENNKTAADVASDIKRFGETLAARESLVPRSFAQTRKDLLSAIKNVRQG